jgi:phospholipase/carboxylesterase
MAKQMKRHKIGSLDCIDIDDSSQPATKALILLHGYGANCDDLASLSNMIRVPGLRMIFPNGPQEVDLGGHMSGRAWFPISISDLERTNSTGAPPSFESMTPPGSKKAREAVSEMISRLSLPLNQIVVGGFSQGAMLATDVCLQSHEQMAGLVILSGALVNKELWAQKLAQHKGLQFFQSHGEQDPVLPYSSAKNLNQMLLAGGAKGQMIGFRGGHEIPLEVISRLQSFISQVFTRK